MKLNEDFSTRSKLKDIGRWHITRFVEDVARGLPPRSRLLDAGAGECVYARFFSRVRYVSIDLAMGESAWNYRNLDCVGTLNRLPFRDESFDAVLCTETLEHVEWPRECVEEFFRVLKPGGRLFLTVPMAIPEHQTPYDFFRYTSYGLKSICGQAGFARIEVAPFGGLFTRLACELPQMLSVFPPSGVKARRLEPKGLPFLPIKLALLIAIRLAQMVLLAIDRFDRVKNYPVGWRVTAWK